MISNIYNTNDILFKSGSRKGRSKKNIERSVHKRKDKKKNTNNSWMTSTKENQSLIDSLYHKYALNQTLSENELIDEFVNKSGYYTIIDIEYIGKRLKYTDEKIKLLINELIPV